MEVRYYAKQMRGPARGVPIETDHATFARTSDHDQTTFHGKQGSSTYRVSFDGSVIVEKRISNG